MVAKASRITSNHEVVLNAYTRPTRRTGKRPVGCRTTRHLLAGARANGFTYHDLGSILGVSPSAIRNRTIDDGPVSAFRFAALAGIALDELTVWHGRGLLTGAIPGPGGQTSYLAGELIRALLAATPRAY